MAQDHSIDWVGQQTRPWETAHGHFLDYTIALAGEEGTVKLSQKADTPAPVVGNQLHGRIETKHFTKADGEAFEVRKFVKEQREDGAAPTRQAQNNAARRGPDSPGPEFWAAKDRRLARAGMTQAVVGAYPPHGDRGDDLEAWVKGVARLTDMLLEDLEKRTPSPNQTSPATLDPSSGGSADAKASAGEQEGSPEPPAPDLSQLKLALAANGFDNSDPERTYKGLNPDQKAKVSLILTNLKNNVEGEIPGNTVSDDDSIPF